MRRERVKPWHRLWLIIPALVLVSPLGLALLWTSPRKTRAKIIGTAIFLALLIGAVGGVVNTGLYKALLHNDGPIGLYDTSLNSRGRYNTPEVLPYEREVFVAVVREARRIKGTLPPAEEALSIEHIVPEAKAFEIVAEEKQIPVKDVEEIYLKVSRLITKKEKR